MRLVGALIKNELLYKERCKIIKYIQEKKYNMDLISLVVVNIFTQESSYFDLKYKIYGFLKFEFLKNVREREKDM